MGGDQQLRAKITKRELDILIFFVDPLDTHTHEADISTLIRLSRVYGIVCALQVQIRPIRVGRFLIQLCILNNSFSFLFNENKTDVLNFQSVSESFF